MNDFMKKPKNFLVYCGSAGIGKTYFASALAEWYIQKFNFVRYWKEDAMLNRCRKSINNYSYGDYNEELKYMLDDDFIILDDIGSTGRTDWREEILFSAIDFRYNSMKPTVITSNLLQEDFRKLYHPRIADRIFASENKIIQIRDGQSKRDLGY